MPDMTDPFNGLTSFQEEYRAGRIAVQAGDVDPKTFVHYDEPEGEPRWTYIRRNGKEVTALVNIVLADPNEGLPCFAIGVAVAHGHRKKGLAKSLMRSAIAELQHGLSRNGMKAFYIEAIVGTDNEASQRVAAAVISSDPTPCTDGVSGQPALQYLRRIEGPQPVG